MKKFIKNTNSQISNRKNQSIEKIKSFNPPKPLKFDAYHKELLDSVVRGKEKIVLKVIRKLMGGDIR